MFQLRLLITGMAHIMGVRLIFDDCAAVQCGGADKESADGQDFADRER
jgi:hypothetical protein